MHDSIEAGSALRYSLVVSNRGPAVATGVILTDSLPTGVEFVEASASRGTFSHTGGAVVFSLGRLEVASAVSVSVVVRSHAAGTLVNRVSVTGAEPDPDLGNNLAEQQTTVLGALAQLRLVMVGNQAILTWPSQWTGLTLEYTEDLAQASGWRPLFPEPELDGNLFVATDSASAGKRFYRLSAAPAGPRLNAVRTGAGLVLSWPASLTGYVLEQRDSLHPHAGWTVVLAAPTTEGGRFKVVEPIAGAAKFYRLTRGTPPTGPGLGAALVGGNLVLTWPSVEGFVLEATDALGPASAWTLAPFTPESRGSDLTVTVPTAGKLRFFRLRAAAR
jgi:uncharacterized repeat protein (TIGR01451 family)